MTAEIRSVLSEGNKVPWVAVQSGRPGSTHRAVHHAVHCAVQFKADGQEASTVRYTEYINILLGLRDSL